MDNKTIIKIVSMRIEGISYEVIADDLGISVYDARMAAKKAVSAINKDTNKLSNESFWSKCQYVNVAKYMRDHKLSAHDFAVKLGITRQHLYNSLKQIDGMPVALARRIAKLTGQSLSWVYEIK